MSSNLNPDQLSDEQFQQMEENVRFTEMLLEQLVQSTTEHLEYTDSKCVLPCLGGVTGQVLDRVATEPDLPMMLLTLAVRRLADQRRSVRRN